MRRWIETELPQGSNLIAAICDMAMDFDHALVLSDQHLPRLGYYNELNRESLLAGLGALEVVNCPILNLESALNHDDWYLGFLGYGLKNELFEGLSTLKPPRVEFPSLCFFRPRWLIRSRGDKILVGYDDSTDDEQTARLLAYEASRSLSRQDSKIVNQVRLRPAIDFNSYSSSFRSLKAHINRGDIYEVNFCMEFTDDKANINPPSLFGKMAHHLPMPFSAFLKHEKKFALCASPERYLTRVNGKIYSMPMKGTAPRGETAHMDTLNLERLISSGKERAENIMITDLVRNDLSRVAARGSVKVNELCRAYPFPGVFQVVSTISAIPASPGNWAAPIVSTFPMGSMTGAPKLSAMKLIDQHEAAARGLFSGSMGYVTPEKEFDFNVVIRTLFYDHDQHLATYHAGSAITAMADAESEYAECLLKTKTVSATFK